MRRSFASKRVLLCSSLLSGLLTTLPQAALAQASSNAGGADPTTTGAQQVEEVIVTARKRDETSISVPVSITALGANQIARDAIFNTFDIAQRYPTLHVNQNASSGGGSVYLRGVGSTVANIPVVDQSVSFDVDGAPISRGNVLRVGSYDLDEIQILKGPQALFFGKNSSVGVISLKSKDPGREFDAMLRLGYEPYARTRFGEAAIDQPITDTLRARLFYRRAESDGRDKNLVRLALPANAIVPNSVFVPSQDRIFNYDDNFVRGTIIWEPSDRFTARIKASFDAQDSAGPGSVRERFYCPLGKAQNGLIAATLGAGANAAALASALSVDDCKANGTYYEGAINPAQLLDPKARQVLDGGIRTRIWLTSADLTYHLTESIDLSSVTAFARINDRVTDQYSFGPVSLAGLVFENLSLYRQVSQEVRARAHLNNTVSLMVGGFYEHAFIFYAAPNVAISPFNRPEYRIPNDVWSGFAQATINVTPTLELAGGARYTWEKKSLTFLRDGVPQQVPVPRTTFKNTSPEVTLTWRPASDMTVYGGYRTGFKSGGYASAVTGNFPPNSVATDPRFIPFKPEKSKGFELGWKALLLDRTLRIDSAAYRFDFSELQNSNVDFSTGRPIVSVYNSGELRQKGVEIDATYYPYFVHGLNLHGLVNYNSVKYRDGRAPCWVGQSIAEGCNVGLLLGQFRQQDLTGLRPPNASKWSSAAGATFTRQVSGRTFEIGGDGVYRSSYNTMPDFSPGGFQKSYVVVNLQARLIDEKHGWEFGVYAKNIGNVRRAIEGNNDGFTGISANTGTVNGGVTSRSDLSGNISPGRTLLFQLTLRPAQWVR